jgi:hypothetical protein
MLLAAGALVAARNWAGRTYSTPAAQQQWEQFQQAEAAKGEAPVKRRIPSSREPPALVLVREYYGVVFIMSLALLSILFGVLMIMLRGAFATGSQSFPLGDVQHDEPPDV